jgi:hypothetical protein
VEWGRPSDHIFQRHSVASQFDRLRC